MVFPIVVLIVAACLLDKSNKQRSKASKVFYQFTLVQAARVEGKVKQRAILYLGSDKLLENKNNRKTVLAILKSKIFKQSEMFPQDVSWELKM